MQELDVMVMLAYGQPYTEAMACLAEAGRLRKPIILVTDNAEQGLVDHASVVVAVHRGEAGRVALHGATFVCLEAISLALVSHDEPLAIGTLERLNELRKSVGKTPQ
jgi:DNA-binding MurR/RpiR family transcriptional regulator